VFVAAGSRDIQRFGSAHDDAELERLKAAARQRPAAGHPGAVRPEIDQAPAARHPVSVTQ